MAVAAAKIGAMKTHMLRTCMSTEKRVLPEW